MVATSCCEVINLSKCYTTHIVSSGYMHHLTGYKVVKLQKVLVIHPIEHRGLVAGFWPQDSVQDHAGNDLAWYRIRWP